jgi:hypothetical protein
LLKLKGHGWAARGELVALAGKNRRHLSLDEKETLLEAIRTAVNAAGGKRVTRQQFLNSSGFKVADIFRHFPKWSDALTAAGCAFDPYNAKIPKEDLLTDWGELSRSLGRIPTRNEYKLQGNQSTARRRAVC